MLPVREDSEIPLGVEQTDDQIDEKVFEKLIGRAIDKKCFIEVISLVHNVIEAYLKYLLRRAIFEKHNEQALEFLNQDEINKTFSDKVKILEGRGKSNYLKYVEDYKEMCYLFDLIDKKLFDDITEFNQLRNNAIHKLLRPKKKGEEWEYYKYREIVETAKLGREVQLRLSPLNHSEEDIQNVLDQFGMDLEDTEDTFLRGCDLPIRDI